MAILSKTKCYEGVMPDLRKSSEGESLVLRYGLELVK